MFYFFIFLLQLRVPLVAPSVSDGKESSCKAGDLGLIPGLERSPEQGLQPTQYSCLENPHGQRSLVGYSPWDHKESDTIEHLPGSSVCGIPQARILEWVAMPSSRGTSQPRAQTCISCGSCIAGGFFTTELPGEAPINEYSYTF